MPLPTEIYPIPVYEWERLMNRMKDSGERTSEYQACKWACVGLFAGFFISAISFPVSTPLLDASGKPTSLAASIVEGMFITFAIASFAVGIAAHLFAKQHKSDHQRIRESIFDDMQGLAERHPP